MRSLPAAQNTCSGRRRDRVRTVGTGCILERGDGRCCTPGEVVELEIEGIGVLPNSIA